MKKVGERRKKKEGKGKREDKLKRIYPKVFYPALLPLVFFGAVSYAHASVKPNMKANGKSALGITTFSFIFSILRKYISENTRC